MAQDYTVSAAVKRDTWSNDYGKYQTYAVQFEENGENWIKWNKKFKKEGEEYIEPEAPKKGDTVYGSIENGKFKIERKNEGGFSGGFKGSEKKEWQPRDDDRIVAQWAIGQAVSLFNKNNESIDLATGGSSQWIEDNAEILYAMVDRVKGSGQKDAMDVLTSGEQVDMSQIPF